jgi:hypothetical protein
MEEVRFLTVYMDTKSGNVLPDYAWDKNERKTTSGCRKGAGSLFLCPWKPKKLQAALDNKDLSCEKIIVWVIRSQP